MIDASSLAPQVPEQACSSSPLSLQMAAAVSAWNDGACGSVIAGVDLVVCTCYVHDCLAEERERGYPRESGEMNRNLLHSRYGEQSAFRSSFFSPVNVYQSA